MVDSVAVSKHYDKKYFDWQKHTGQFGGWANYHKFADYIKPTDRVLDYGCSGGYLLERLTCAEKYGVEPNEHAAVHARKIASKVFASSAELPESFVDIVISNHALEHSLNPLAELKNLHRCLVTGGKIIIVVPCENISYAYEPNDINHHLFSWSPMCLGNLLGEGGFTVIESKAFVHAWPPFYRVWAKLGWPIFNLLCRIYGQLNRKLFQVRAIATKN